MISVKMVAYKFYILQKIHVKFEDLKIDLLNFFKNRKWGGFNLSHSDWVNACRPPAGSKA
jgi:hypothetical protein